MAAVVADADARDPGTQPRRGRGQHAAGDVGHDQHASRAGRDGRSLGVQRLVIDAAQQLSPDELREEAAPRGVRHSPVGRCGAIRLGLCQRPLEVHRHQQQRPGAAVIGQRVT